MIGSGDQTFLTGFNASYLNEKGEKSIDESKATREDEREARVNEQVERIINPARAETKECLALAERVVLKSSQSEEGFEIVDPEMEEVEAESSKLFSAVNWLFSGFKRNDGNEVIERARERCLALETELHLQNRTIDVLDNKLKIVDSAIDKLKQDNKSLKEENGTLKDNQEILQNQIRVLMQENNRLKEALEKK